MLSNKDINFDDARQIITINGEAHKIEPDTSELEEEVAELSETVGDNTGGLVKEVNDLNTRIDNMIMHVSGETSVTIPLSDSYTACIFGTISVTPISAILTVVTGGTVDITDLTSNTLATRADISVDLNAKTLTIASKNTDKFYVNILA